jgi:hypothetical protein
MSDSVGLPTGFHEASRDVYERLAHLKDAASLTVDDISSALLNE